MNRHNGTATDYDQQSHNGECEYPLANGDAECRSFECRCRRGRHLWNMRKAIEEQGEQKAYEESLRRMELTRYSRSELGPLEQLDEIIYLTRQIEYCLLTPPTPIRDEAIALYRQELRRMHRVAAAERGIVTKPRFHQPRDFALLKMIDLQDFAQTFLGQEGWPSGQNRVFLCPMHAEDSPSLTVYPPGRGWYCFGCGKGGQDGAALVAAVNKISMIAAFDFIVQMVDVPDVEDDHATNLSDQGEGAGLSGGPDRE